MLSQPGHEDWNPPPNPFRSADVKGRPPKLLITPLGGRASNRDHDLLIESPKERLFVDFRNTAHRLGQPVRDFPAPQVKSEGFQGSEDR